MEVTNALWLVLATDEDGITPVHVVPHPRLNQRK
jgi:hypothetical protein